MWSIIQDLGTVGGLLMLTVIGLLIWASAREAIWDLRAERRNRRGNNLV